MRAGKYDVLWNQGFRTPELALNRARAHRLAGNLPRAIAALHEGLAVTRFSRALQVELEDARAAVQFPLDGELAAQCKPLRISGVSTPHVARGRVGTRRRFCGSSPAPGSRGS